jgi:hypothetical protein
MFRRPALAGLVLASIGCGLVSAPADGKVPDPRFTRVSTTLVGCPSGEAVPTMVAGGGGPETRVLGFRVEAREVNNAPLSFRQVTLDFSKTSIRLIADDSPDVTVDCVNRRVNMLTGVDGVAVFHPRFCGSTLSPDVVVLVEGVVMRELPAFSIDIDGNGSIGLADFVRFAANFNSGAADPATDFDASTPGTTLTDFVIFAREFQRDASGGVACP